ncbi:hypothetical protein GYMLUDRAFT_243624 [Collybiopsis luxurians FD-317 M1]|uniref:NADH:flavin oxidoreductase/NADH oxidase N-terminal domain-containing protein n=1 Tax=Collybiopsis luxurians FD-317 M1 TaxID=944289 RepID=A0A0D0CYK3_9AGAR|nr:hypothetical protein GYMLUDRAFT_243624 [Collybiopsis luxurians FD-317 M1]
MVIAPPPAQTASGVALLQPAHVGYMTLKHRVVLAPLTRMRADKAHVLHPIVKEYYSQQASIPGTFLIAEATLISHQAGGYAHVPGIWSNEQISRWKEITQAIHSKGSFVYLQLWAQGCTAAPRKHIQPELLRRLVDNVEPNFPYDFVSASDIPINPDDPQKPRPLTIDEIKEYYKWYATAAKNAVEGAGFDGVDIHGASGYLVDQFFQDMSNSRMDEYRGSVENRARFGLEVVDAVLKAVGPEKTAIRINIKENLPDGEDNDFIREIWTQEGNSRWLISAGGYSRDIAIQTVEQKGGLVAFGRAFLANANILLVTTSSDSSPTKLHITARPSDPVRAKHSAQ